MSRPHADAPSMIRRLASTMSLAVLAGLVVGCSSDNESSARGDSQEEYCQAGKELQDDLTSLETLNVVEEGTNTLEGAISTIDDDLSDLADAASGASEDEVQALQDSVDEVQSALNDLGGEVTADNASAVAGAVQGAIDSAGAVFDTLSDC